MKSITKSGLIFLVTLLLLPGILRSAHIFANHQHTYCDHHSDSHLHQSSLDCSLFSFQQQPFQTIKLFNAEIFSPEIPFQVPISVSFFLGNSLKESPTTRGPPKGKTF